MAARYPNGENSAIDLGDDYAEAGAFDQATAWLERGYGAERFGLFAIPFSKGIPAAYFDTAGWRALRSRPLFVDWQRAHDRLAAELAAGNTPAAP